MYAVVDALIFPAPSSNYTQESLEGKLIYVPKFKRYVPDGKLFEGAGAKNISNNAKRKRQNTLDAVQRDRPGRAKQSLDGVGLFKLQRDLQESAGPAKELTSSVCSPVQELARRKRMEEKAPSQFQTAQANTKQQSAQAYFALSPKQMPNSSFHKNRSISVNPQLSSSQKVPKQFFSDVIEEEAEDGLPTLAQISCNVRLDDFSSYETNMKNQIGGSRPMEPKKIEHLDFEPIGPKNKLQNRKSPRNQGYIENQISDSVQSRELAVNEMKIQNLKSLKDLYKESSQVPEGSKAPKTTKHKQSKAAQLSFAEAVTDLQGQAGELGNNGSERMSHAEPSFRESNVAPVSSPYAFSVQKGAISVMGKSISNEVKQQYSQEFQQKQVQWTQVNEKQKLIKFKEQASAHQTRDFIPCLYFKGRSKKVLIHFHANGEDVSLTQPLMEQIVQKLKLNIICMEYPGYGIYQDYDSALFAGSKTQQRAQQILQDADTVYRFLRDTCGVSEEDILISGRSIGSGPACHIASTFKPACLMLISPIKSVKDVARQKYGRIVDLLIEERFNNFEAVTKVQCPSAIFHGIQDSMVPYQHSIEMLLQGFSQCPAHMFLRDGMEHNRFDYTNDLIKPIRYFLKHHDIDTKPRRRLSLSPLESKLKKNIGYIDKKAANYAKMFGVTNRSQYYNNFQTRFTPNMPQMNAKGGYDDQDLQVQQFDSVISKDSSEIVTPSYSSNKLPEVNTITQQKRKLEVVNQDLPPNGPQFSKQMPFSPKSKAIMDNIQQISSKNQMKQTQQQPSNTLQDILNNSTQQKSKSENIDESCRVDTNEEDVAQSPTDAQVPETHNLESKETLRESYFNFKDGPFQIQDEFDDENMKPVVMTNENGQQNRCLSPLSAAKYLSCQPEVSGDGASTTNHRAEIQDTRPFGFQSRMNDRFNNFKESKSAMDVNSQDTRGNTNTMSKAQFKSAKKKGGVTTEESDGCGSGSEHENVVAELTLPSKLMNDLASPTKAQMSADPSTLKHLPGKLSTPALMAKEIENQTGQKPKLSRDSLVPKLEVFTMNPLYFRKPIDQIVQNKTYIDSYLKHIEVTKISNRTTSPLSKTAATRPRKYTLEKKTDKENGGPAQVHHSTKREHNQQLLSRGYDRSQISANYQTSVPQQPRLLELEQPQYQTNKPLRSDHIASLDYDAQKQNLKNMFLQKAKSQDKNEVSQAAIYYKKEVVPLHPAKQYAHPSKRTSANQMLINQQINQIQQNKNRDIGASSVEELHGAAEDDKNQIHVPQTSAANPKMSIKDRNKHAAAKPRQQIQGREYREESKAIVTKSHKVQKSSDYLAAAGGQVAPNRGQETRVLMQEVKDGALKAFKESIKGHQHSSINSRERQQNKIGQKSIFAVDGQVEYEIESLNDEEPGIKIQLSQTNQTLVGQNTMSLKKKYFGPNRTNSIMNLTKLDNTLNTSTNSMNKNAPPSTMPVNKTFANNKLIVRKLQFKTKNESNTNTHKQNGKKLRRNQTGKTIQKVDLDNSGVSSVNEKLVTKSDERQKFNNTVRIANLKPILQKIKLEKQEKQDQEPQSDVNKTQSDSSEQVDLFQEQQQKSVSGGQFQQLGYNSATSMRQSGLVQPNKAQNIAKMKKNYLAYNQQHLSQKIIQKKSNMRQSPVAWSGSLSNSNFNNTQLNPQSIHKKLNIHQLQQSYGSLAGLSKLTADDKTQTTTAETAMSSGTPAFARTIKLHNTKSMQLLQADTVSVLNRKIIRPHQGK